MMSMIVITAGRPPEKQMPFITVQSRKHQICVIRMGLNNNKLECRDFIDYCMDEFNHYQPYNWISS